MNGFMWLAVFLYACIFLGRGFLNIRNAIHLPDIIQYITSLGAVFVENTRNSILWCFWMSWHRHELL